MGMYLNAFNMRNQIVDVTPLAALTALKGLGLAHNQIVDVTPLAGLKAAGCRIYQ